MSYEPRYGGGSGGHGHRLRGDELVEKRDGEHRGRNTAIGGVVGTAAAHEGATAAGGEILLREMRAMDRQYPGSVGDLTSRAKVQGLTHRELYKPSGLKSLYGRGQGKGKLFLAGGAAAGAGVGALSAGRRKAAVGKRFREYEPEHRRQRRLGMYEAGLGIGGTTAIGFGAHGTKSQTKTLRALKIATPGHSGVETVGQSHAGKGAIKFTGRNIGLLAGGTAALGGVAAIRRNAENNRYRARD